MQGTAHKKGGLRGTLAVLGLAMAASSAQADFIANFHENVSTGNNILYIFGAQGTAGTIIGNDGLNEAFVIGASGVFERNFGPRGREMTVNGALNSLSLRVESANPISGIALNRAPATTDQTNLLDTDGLGNEYLVLSTPGVFGSGGQFSVTATEDNTTVTIESPIALAGNPANTPFNVTLNEGETVFFESGTGGDVSGTQITSSADVAVFAGAECTQVPVGTAYCDHLIAQQFSVDNFDTEFQIVENFGGGADADHVRVIASVDGTEVFLDGVSQGIINRGEVMTLDKVGNSVVTASEPVSVGQFTRGQTGTRTLGDPAFAIIPSVNQTLDDYVFTTPVGGDAFSQNFLNIAIDQAIAGSLMLNGAAVNTAGFDLVGTTLFGNVAVGQGIGRVSASDVFLATTSGFSSADSFFNPIATSFSTGSSPPVTPPVPVPGTLALFAAGLLAAFGRRRLQQRR